MNLNYTKWRDEALEKKSISREDALAILQDKNIDILKLVMAAGEVRKKFWGKKVMVHQINNIQSGLCKENCGYCGQATGSNADIEKYPMLDEDAIVAEAAEAKKNGVSRYCMVSSGRGPTEIRANQLAKIITRVKDEVGIKTCLSAGLVDDETAVLFKKSGLDRLNHNLNTSEKHTPNVVTTHTYADRINTLESARKAGLESCSGMITGMGENDDDILDVAFALRELKTPSIPVNFLVPVKGNRVYDYNQLSPEKCLRILCAYRFINPEAELRMGGGREGHLRMMQPLALYPANSLFVDGYLVTRGEKKNKVYQMIEDAGFEIDGFIAEDANEQTSAEKFQIDDNQDIIKRRETTEV